MHVSLRNLIFVVYWVLLMILGPSCHHAEVFGLHSGQSASASCCCCHHPSASDPETAALQSNDRCAVCDFFEYCDFDSAEFFMAETSSQAYLKVDELVGQYAHRRIVISPRGPPADHA